jgi:hypothetical protein
VFKKRRPQRPKAKKILSTVPYADTLRIFEKDCLEKGVSPSERQRQILDEYYSNERLKTIGRDVAESPIRNLYREALVEELSPVKAKLTEVEKTAQTVRSVVEDLLGNVAQIGLASGDTPPVDADVQVRRLEVAIGELAGQVERLTTCVNEAKGNGRPNSLPLSDELANELNIIKGLTANLAIRTLKETVRAVVQAEVGSRHVVQVSWSRKDGIEVFAVRKVVEKVADPRTEIAFEDAKICYGEKVQVGSYVKMSLLSRADLVRQISEAVNQVLQPEE